ncbi:MAG: amidase [Collimonas sp.]
MNFQKMDASDIANAVQTGQTSAPAVIDSFLETIACQEPTIQAFASFDADLVRLQATGLSASSQQGALAGVPIGVKDMIDTADYPTEFFSPIYKENRPVRDAHVVTLLKQAGAIVMGKTHTTEFAYMHTGPTRNPLALDRTPGSSSAGSAAGMAAGFFPLAFGTQTAGSLIKPASYCGLCAFKPSLGLVSLEGIKPLAPTFDTVGWYGRSIRDLSLVASVLIPGFQLPLPKQHALRLAFCRMPDWGQVTSSVEHALAVAVKTLRDAGHEIVEIELPAQFADVYSVHQIINDCEATRALWKEYQAYPELLSESTLAVIARGIATDWETESAAVKRLSSLAPMLEDIIAPFDAILTASTGIVAPVGLSQTGSSDFIKFWTAFGLPQVNIPIAQALATQGSEVLSAVLPVGLQLISGKRCDRSLLRTAELLHAVISA